MCSESRATLDNSSLLSLTLTRDALTQELHAFESSLGAMRNFSALLLVLSLVVVANLAQVPCLPEVELADRQRVATNALRLRRLHTTRPAPLGYPPPPTVAEPPTAAPAPAPSV